MNFNVYFFILKERFWFYENFRFSFLTNSKHVCLSTPPTSTRFWFRRIIEEIPICEVNRSTVNTFVMDIDRNSFEKDLLCTLIFFILFCLCLWKYFIKDGRYMSFIHKPLKAGFYLYNFCLIKLYSIIFLFLKIGK